MKVMLNDAEIKVALVDYVVGQGIDVSGKEVVVDMTAGRGENGFSANIDIVDARVESATVSDKTEAVPTESNPLGEDAVEAPPEEPDDSTNLFPSPA